MDEIFYHVFQRSFFDSTGDGHGDLAGLESKLDYIQELGATSILILPLYDSSFYHNYFANDFRKIDPSYGSMSDYLSLIDSIHKRGMKLYLDMEVQYVAEDHLWFKDSFENPSSPYTEHIIYNGPGNTLPESIIFDLTEIHGYDGQVKKVACLNLFNSNTSELIFEEFKFWTDPYGDGSLRLGVDGFRLDHLMDDLDEKGTLTEVYSRFWHPLIQKVRDINPVVKFIGEQADWQSHGQKEFIEADVDYMFAFPLKFAITDRDKHRIEWAQKDGIDKTPAGKQQVLIIENHDTTRYATLVDKNPGLLRVGATLNILLTGFPAIYYGQELGMSGAGGFQSYGITDGNDIPRREAFPWEATMNSAGTTLWYKDSGPWWDDTESADHNGVSVEEQLPDSDSLLNFYKNLLRIRRENPAFQEGGIEFLDTHTDDSLAFVRMLGVDRFVVNVNFSSESRPLVLGAYTSARSLLSYPLGQDASEEVAPFGVLVLELLEDRMLTNSE